MSDICMYLMYIKIKYMKKIKKFIPFISIIIMTLFMVITIKYSEQPLSVKTILNYTPDNKIYAASILFIFFALKSLTVIFPLSILYLASGIIFPATTAIFVSIIGLAITITIPYWIGKYSGNTIIQELCQKYPRVKQLSEYQEKNLFFACFITRIIGILPGDIVSMYFGACNVTYPIYLTAGIAGSMLNIIATTLLGEKINDPFSREFIMVLLFRIMISVSALVINYTLNHRKT